MYKRQRVFSILTSPNVFGSLLTLATPMSISMCLSSKKKGGKFIFGFLALMMAASLVFTFSRGAWIGFVLAIGIDVYKRQILTLLHQWTIVNGTKVKLPYQVI